MKIFINNNFELVKPIYLFIIKLKTNKYYEELFYYLFYILFF